MGEAALLPAQQVVSQDVPPAAPISDDEVVASIVAAARSAIATGDKTALQAAIQALGPAKFSSREAALTEGLVQAAIEQQTLIASQIAPAAQAVAAQQQTVQPETVAQVTAPPASATETSTVAPGVPLDNAQEARVAKLLGMPGTDSRSTEALAAAGIKPNTESALAIK